MLCCNLSCQKIKKQALLIKRYVLALAGIRPLALLRAMHLIAEVHAAGEDRPNLDSVIFHTHNYE